MKLTPENPLQAIACALAATSIALVTMAASTSAAGDVRVFNEKVSGVPAANCCPNTPSDNIYSPEFVPGLINQGSARESLGPNHAIREP